MINQNHTTIDDYVNSISVCVPEYRTEASSGDPITDEISRSFLIPKGTCVAVKATVECSDYDEKRYLEGMLPLGTSLSKKGNIMVSLHLSVISGKYGPFRPSLYDFTGAYEFTEYLIIKTMNPNKFAVNKSIRIIRGILASARGVKLTDKSPEAQAKLQIENFMDLDGLTFPIVVGVSRMGEELKNSISQVITPDRPQWREILDKTQAELDAAREALRKEEEFKQTPEYLDMINTEIGFCL